MSGSVEKPREEAEWIVGLLSLTLVLVAVLGEARGEQSGEPPGPRITFHKSPEGVRGIKLRLYLKSEPDRVWQVVTHPSKASALFKNVSAIEASHKGSQYQDYHLSSRLGEKVVTCAITRDNTRLRIRWKRVEGHLVDLHGYFSLGRDARYPEHTRLDYGSYIDPGGIGRVLMTKGRRRKAVLHMIGQLQRFLE